MDELLPSPRGSIFAPVPRRSQRTRSLLSGLPHLTLPHPRGFLERRSPMGPAVFLTLALSVCAAGAIACTYTPGYRLTVDGVDLGLVSDRAAVEAAVERVESRASHILGYDYTLASDLSYSFEMSSEAEPVPVSLVETYLFNQIGEVMKTSVLTVDGQVLGATDDAAAMDAMLDAIKAPYVNENTVWAEFVQPLEVKREYTSTTMLRDISELQAILTSNSMEQVDYAVQRGDTFSGIANSCGLRVSELQALNPDVDINKLMIGQTLVVSQAVPYLSVQTMEHVTYDGPLAFDTEEVLDDSIYQGYTKVVTPGVEGSATFVADVTYLNGVEQERTISSTQVHTQPVTQVVAVGTKPRPKTMATGKFIWPIYGHITSGYGSRYIFGSYSFHAGIDIAGSYGASIVASDGGRVTFAGTGTGGYWSYGKYVVIDHENGLQTIYAHCSSLCVSAGERVYQGQVIARVGSTGRSTGNHCHFQVKQNGSTVNPWNYLP